MREISASDLLNAWERGLRQVLPRRALLFLAAAHPDAALADLAQLAIGERDARLLGLHEQMFGDRLSGLSACPRCGEQLEIELAVAQVRVPTPCSSSSGAVFSLRVDGLDVTLRLPTSADLVALEADEGAARLRRRVIERCVVEARRGDAEVTADQLSEAALTQLANALGDADPQADVQLEVSCPGCGATSGAELDIVSFLCGEIDAWARRLLTEIHTLASAYGWSEAEILDMSALRRELYLGVAGT